MGIRKPSAAFVTVFALALAASAVATLLWNVIGHGTMAVDWETALCLAVTLSIVSTWLRSRQSKEGGKQ